MPIAMSAPVALMIDILALLGCVLVAWLLHRLVNKNRP